MRGTREPRAMHLTQAQRCDGLRGAGPGCGARASSLRGPAPGLRRSTLHLATAQLARPSGIGGREQAPPSVAALGAADGLQSHGADGFHMIGNIPFTIRGKRNRAQTPLRAKFRRTKMPGVGLEPTRPCGQPGLSRPRMTSFATRASNGNRTATLDTSNFSAAELFVWRQDPSRVEASALQHAGSAGLHGRSPLLRLQSDERLVALVRRGNQAAFEALVARYQSRLLAFCRHMLSSREDAEDVLQEVFAAAFNAMLADERAINVRPWLYRIARNRSLNHLRRTQAIGVDSMDIHLSEGGLTTADKVHKREEFRLLVSDVQDLPETQRTALLLREIDALSYEQISEAMETTVPSVKSLLVRARVSLAEAAEARLLTCEEVRDELGEVAEGLTPHDRARAPAPAHLRALRDVPQAAAGEQQGARRRVPGRAAAAAQEDAARPLRHDRRRAAAAPRPPRAAAPPPRAPAAPRCRPARARWPPRPPPGSPPPRSSPPARSRSSTSPSTARRAPRPSPPAAPAPAAPHPRSPPRRWPCARRPQPVAPRPAATRPRARRAAARPTAKPTADADAGRRRSRRSSPPSPRCASSTRATPRRRPRPSGSTEPTSGALPPGQTAPPPAAQPTPQPSPQPTPQPSRSPRPSRRRSRRRAPRRARRHADADADAGGRSAPRRRRPPRPPP